MGCFYAVYEDADSLGVESAAASDGGAESVGELFAHGVEYSVVGCCCVVEAVGEGVGALGHVCAFEGYGCVEDDDVVVFSEDGDDCPVEGGVEVVEVVVVFGG